MSSHITIVTIDGFKIKKKNKTILDYIFGFFSNYFSDFPEKSTVKIDLSLEKWCLIETFINVLLTPDNKEDWIKLLEAADYLSLVPRYNNILRKEAKKYALSLGATIEDSKKITLVDLRKKIADPKYMSPSEVANYIKAIIFRVKHQEYPEDLY